MHCGNKTFMRLGILTQCHFPSLTWKECTSHNRLHHPAIKPCQGTAFWPRRASFDGKGVHRPTHWAQRGHLCFLSLIQKHPALEHDPWPPALWLAWEACVTLEPLYSHTLSRPFVAPLQQVLGQTPASSLVTATIQGPLASQKDASSCLDNAGSCCGAHFPLFVLYFLKNKALCIHN